VIFASRCSHRPVVLLEVLIAFALVALCALPLIYPHVFILRSEKKFISTVQLDHLVNHLYAGILQKLYQNEIPWQDIENGKAIPIDANLLEFVKYTQELPFTGNYQFIKIRQNPPKTDEKTAYLFNLEFTFIAKPGLFLEKDLKELNPKITYNYQVAVERIQK
jgi:hypothetical protein